MRDFRLSRPWRFKSKSSGLWRRVLLWEDTNVSEDHAASIFKKQLFGVYFKTSNSASSW